MMVDLLVDGQKLTTQRGRNLLSVCLDNDIYIPHLCYLETEENPAAACRLCFVEIEGMPAPVPACTIIIDAEMRVWTDAPTVRRLQRAALRLLLSVHHINCKHCHANRACELQKIARFLKVGLLPKPLVPIDRPNQVDQSHPWIDHYPHRCVLCGKCVHICHSQQALPLFSISGRGIDTVVRHFPVDQEALSVCLDCRRCIDVCPVGALQLRESA